MIVPQSVGVDTAGPGRGSQVGMASYPCFRSSAREVANCRAAKLVSAQAPGLDWKARVGTLAFGTPSFKMGPPLGPYTRRMA